MALQLGDTAPDFKAMTTQGPISFHEWLGNSWGVLFSHPKDFTPVCTTELGYMARLKPEFDKRGVKVIAISVDPVDKHEKWSADILETQGFAPNYPMIGDSDLSVAKLYGMLPASTEGGADGRAPVRCLGGAAGLPSGVPLVADAPIPGTPGGLSLRQYLSDGWHTVVF